ncbi:ribosome maturation factor RimP [Roseivirga pacifica]|uniref:ribosome maturation factor RimP n=1 Tax=Roseivirga pacifica TaxID=1267423 RepID=UPI0020960AB6|nr:ribosome maturation factor RimP [Roseivirga pacifica]MCO6359421.1 ribosome maturation factor RimP [Roseivirga pacifica]MCO6366791.1 ribosome maturation factor RimP [Roseivirga pacifica]MCO6370677.1 ribosome maturation factor RimP [Roseivirga pacifica]MCO6374447.1 ribosome maturation factor RimP [Roseivirga pacifica]MCO6379706.1 ribosome maturation factor RimP [Roseivirga pacifica]
MGLTEKIKETAEKYLKDDSYFIVDVISKGTAGRTKVLVLLDADEGVNIDDCAELSRALGNDIEENEIIEDAYILEVSSPGLDHPLSMKRQFAKNVGRSLRILLKDGGEIRGKFTAMENDELTIIKEESSKKNKKKSTEGETVKIPFGSIEKANVLVSFK